MAEAGEAVAGGTDAAAAKAPETHTHAIDPAPAQPRETTSSTRPARTETGRTTSAGASPDSSRPADSPAPGRYYLLPYAGGGPTAYRPLTEQWAACPDTAPAAVTLGWQSARYLGDGGGLRRLAEDLAHRIADDLAGRPTDRYGLFGHSMGALVAYETAAALVRLDCPLPAVLAASGRVAPQYGFRPAVDPGSADSTAEYLRSCGGALAQAAADPEFVDLVRERLRDDVQLGAEHIHQDREPLPIRILALGGRDDPLASHEETAGWLRHGTGTGELRLHPGGHWYLWDHAAAVTADLRTALHPPTDAEPRASATEYRKTTRA